MITTLALYSIISGALARSALWLLLFDGLSKSFRSVFSIACLIAVRFHRNTSIHVLLTASAY